MLKGEGFLVSPSKAERLRNANPQNESVVWPIINGDEINNEPDQLADRWVVCFENWSVEEATQCKEPFEHVVECVKAQRLAYDEKKNSENKKLKEKWWLFGRYSVELYSKIRSLSRCFVAGVTTKYLSISAVSPAQIFTHALYVIATERWDLFGVMHSNVHESWARQYSGALKQDLRYSPSKCFETYAFPDHLWRTPSETLADIGERYHERRRQLMLNLWLGLTDTYNLFHSPTLEGDIEKLYTKRVKKPGWIEEVPEQHRAGAQAFTPEQAEQGITELRRLHVELDTAVLHAYGWAEGLERINLAHDYYEVETLAENDRTRYTISPEARKEVLKRLLAENHKRAAQEKAQGIAPAASGQVKAGSKTAKPDNTADLFDTPDD